MMKEYLEIWHLAVGLAGIAVVGVYNFATQKAKTDSEIKALKKEIETLLLANTARSSEIIKLETLFLNAMEKVADKMSLILAEIKLLKHITKTTDE